MQHHLYRYIEDGRIIGGPKALPTNWRDKGDISGWSAEALRAEGWLPNYVDDQRMPGEIDAGWTDTLEAVRVIQTLHSRPAPALDPDAIAADYTARLEALYDETAGRRRYDSRFTCALRAGYAGPFQAEGTAFAQWMDDCNAYGYQVLADCQAGLRAIPTWDELRAELPAAPW